MAELRLRVTGPYDSVDVAARFDAGTTVGQLADQVERATDTSTGQTRTLRRLTRGEIDLIRDEPLAQSDLRSGDVVELALDSGVRRPEQRPHGATLRVSSDGADENRTFELEPGEFTAGRSSRCAIVVNGDLVSRHHATFRVGDTVEVVDAGSRNGVLVNGERIAGVRRLRPGDKLSLGDVDLVLDDVHGDHGAVDVTDNALQFNRPPRIDRPFEATTVTFPPPVAPIRPPRIPLIAALVPLVMGAVLYMVTRNLFTIMFLAMSPMLVLGNFVETRRTSRRDQIAAKAEYDALMHDRQIELDDLRADEIRSQHRFHPSAGELRTEVDQLSATLWERRPVDTDFLALRVGLAEAPSSISIDVRQGGTRDQQLELNKLIDSYAELPPVPVTVDCGGPTPVGLAGPAATIRSVARSLLVQAAVLHSPKELLIGGIFGQGSLSEWDWLKWLPHTNSAGTTRHAQLVSRDGEAGIEWAVELQHLIEARLNEIGASDESSTALPRVLVVVDGGCDIERGRFSALLELGARAGVHTLWLDEDARRVPNACRTVITIEPGNATLTVADGHLGAATGSIPVEGFDLDEAETCARGLSPIVDMSAGGRDGRDLPANVSLVDIFGGAEMLSDPGRLQTTWASTRGSRSIAAPVGRHESGPLTVDLRIDGPHGLVGGTTGAGKSEFLQSYLSALALLHSPERVNFLLVDYKGGSAFGDLVDSFDDAGNLIWRGLPHTVGMITDLTPALVHRALISLQAELHRREVILNEHRAKDLIELERRGEPGTPANLLIVVDEFAALAKEVPAFVEGVVDIAQRGRSLGLHLLLATQKPGGVITPNIQANTNLRVALRMATEEESRDVINSPVAGRIDRSTPGRAVMRRGPTDLVPFQSAYVGGTTGPVRTAQLEIGEFHTEGIQWLESATAATPHAPSPSASEENDLRRIVRLANAAADNADVAPTQRPWLDALPAVVDVLDLPRGSDDEAIPLGLLDLPQSQARDIAWFRPDEDGSMLVFGMGGSGKTVLLRSLAVSCGLLRSRQPAHVYGLDFAGRGLDMISDLPHVGDVIPADDYERVTGLFKQLRELVKRRTEVFAAARASTLGEFRRARPDEAPPRILVLLDGFDGFAATYEKLDRGAWLDGFPRLVAEGRSAGLHFVVTGVRRQSFPTALASQVSTRVVLRMATDDEYHAVGVDPKMFDDDSPAGRGRFGQRELQVALSGSDPSTASEAAAITRIARALDGKVDNAAPVRVLPTQIYRTDLPPPARGLRWALDEDFAACGPALDRNLLITGPPRSGKSTALAALVEALAEHGIEPDVYSYAESAALPHARRLEDLHERLTSDDTGLVLIDDAQRLTGTPADALVMAAIKDDRLRAVLVCDGAHARSFDPLMKELRSRGDVCVLQPNADTDSDVLGAPIPRSAAKHPPGRALLRVGEALHLCQIALSETTSERSDRVVVPVE